MHLLCTATDESIKVEGIIQMIVKMGSLAECTWSGVFENWLVDIFLGPTYIERCIK